MIEAVAGSRSRVAVDEAAPYAFGARAAGFHILRKAARRSFTRYFYKPQPLRTLEEIRAEILALEKETEGLLSEIIGGDGQ